MRKPSDLAAKELNRLRQENANLKALVRHLEQACDVHEKERVRGIARIEQDEKDRTRLISAVLLSLGGST
jgi:hypothetical protein